MYKNGFNTYKPSENAPKFVIADVVLDDRTIAWLQENFNGEGKVRLQILSSSTDGKYYFKKNTYVKQEARESVEEAPQVAPEEDNILSSIPF